MKAVEFESTITQAGPNRRSRARFRLEQLRVVVLWRPFSADLAWRSAGERGLNPPIAPKTTFTSNWPMTLRCGEIVLIRMQTTISLLHP